jgi:hypothetical protein
VSKCDKGWMTWARYVVQTTEAGRSSGMCCSVVRIHSAVQVGELSVLFCLDESLIHLRTRSACNWLAVGRDPLSALIGR